MMVSRANQKVDAATLSVSAAYTAARRIGKLSLPMALIQVEQRLCGWTARYGMVLTRVSLGIVFLWFGMLKFLHGTTAIDALAEHTIGMITLHLVPPVLTLHILAAWECLIGLGLLLGAYLRTTLLLLLLHLPGTFLPLILLPRECWIHFPFFPSLVGHYILKNFVLVSAGIMVASGARGGKMIANPAIARQALHLEILKEERELLAMERLESIKAGEKVAAP